jgi:ketosteroid isomerase-like protein
MSDEQIVRDFFAAYRAGDRAAAEALVADGFVFTSPQDDHIDRAAFFELCFPTASRLQWQELLHVVGAETGGVFVLYEYVLTTGERHRNCEFITVRDGRVVESQVYFGGRFDR